MINFLIVINQRFKRLITISRLTSSFHSYCEEDNLVVAYLLVVYTKVCMSLWNSIALLT